MTTKKQGDVFWVDARGEQRQTFTEAFPTIADVRVWIEETGPGNEGLGVRAFEKRAVREYVNCSRPTCTGKAFSLANLLRGMIQQNVDSRTFVLQCEGTDEARHDPCDNRFVIEIQITFAQPIPGELTQG